MFLWIAVLLSGRVRFTAQRIAGENRAREHEDWEYIFNLRATEERMKALITDHPNYPRLRLTLGEIEGMGPREIEEWHEHLDGMRAPYSQAYRARK